MRTHLLGALLVAAVTVTAQQPTPFTSKTNLVVVPAVVVDGKGVAIGGLTQADFQVFEDGKAVAIETFLAPAEDTVTGEDGRFIVVALDNLTTPPEIAFRVKNIARLLVDRMGPKDVMSIISINGGKAVTTAAKSELNAAIGRFATSGGVETMTGEQRTRHGLRMISSLSQQVERVPHRRKVMVFIGTAQIFSPSEPSGGPSPEWQDAIAATTRNNISVYVIDPNGLAGEVADWSQSFSGETGGAAFSRTNKYDMAVDRIWQESASYYLIGYAAPTSDGRIHKIEVKVSKPGATIRARKARG
jgi:VWFA-related protein